MQIIRRYFIFSSILVLCYAANVNAADTWTIDTKQSSIRFKGTSTLHTFYGKAASFRGDFTSGNSSDSFPFSGRLIIDVKNMDTENDKRDHHMYEMFDAETYSEIIFEAEKINYTDNLTQAVVNGRLRIKDTTVLLSIPVEVIQHEKTIELKGTTDLSLKECNLKAPSAMLIVKVFDKVTVAFDLIFIKEI